MSDKLKSALKWGLVGAIAAAILGLIFYILNVAYDSKLKYLSFAIMIGVIMAGAYEFRDRIQGGYASFKQIFKYAMLVALIYGLISSLWSICYMQFIDTGLVNEILLNTELDMEARGADTEAIKQGMMFTKKMMNPPMMFVTTFLFIMFISLIVALPVSLSLKNEKPEDLIIEEKLAE